MCVCVCVRARVCVCARVHACVRACVCVILEVRFAIHMTKALNRLSLQILLGCFTPYR